MTQNDFFIKKINLTKCTKRKFYTKDFYTIILISKGNCDFELQHGVTSCNTETALLLKPDTSIQMEYRNDKKALELFAIHIHPSLLVKLSDESCDLVHGFSFIPLDKAMIHLDTLDTTLIKNITKTTMTLLEETTEFGHELYLKNMVSILLVLFLRSCIASDHVKLSHRKKNWSWMMYSVIFEQT